MQGLLDDTAGMATVVKLIQLLRDPSLSIEDIYAELTLDPADIPNEAEIRAEVGDEFYEFAQQAMSEAAAWDAANRINPATTGRPMFTHTETDTANMQDQTALIDTTAPDATAAPNGTQPTPMLRRGLSLASIKSKVKIVSIAYEDDHLDVWYRPSVVTPNVLTAFDTNENNVDKLVEMIGTFVSQWDLLDAEGDRLPIEAGVLRDLPVSFMNAVILGIMADMAPNEPTATGSFTG